MVKRTLWAGILAAVAMLTAPLASHGGNGSQDVAVDLELVLAVDSSFSIGIDERDVQRLAYVDAFRNPRVVAAMTSGHFRQIAVVYIEWGDAGFQRVVVPWRVIATPADADRFASDLAAAPVQRSGATSISAALDFAASLFSANGFRSPRQLIDLSGDGLNNDGGPVELARDRLNSNGVTVNALPLASGKADLSPEDLTAYYEHCVTGGPNAFTMPAATSADFALAMQRKLITEIAGIPPLNWPTSVTTDIWRVSFKAEDCLSGEKRRRKKYLDMLNDLTNGRPERWHPDESTWPKP